MTAVARGEATDRTQMIQMIMNNTDSFSPNPEIPKSLLATFSLPATLGLSRHLSLVTYKKQPGSLSEPGRCLLSLVLVVYSRELIS